MADVLERLNEIDTVKEYLLAQELHKDEGRHIHVYVKFEKGVKLSDAPLTFDCQGYHGNYQPARSCKAVVSYCKKDGDYISNFDVNRYKAKKGKVTSATLATYTAIEALDQGIVSLNSLKNYEYARSLAVKPKERSDVCGLWIWGPPESGKSRYARELAGSDVYLKAQNKWWDGYVGQSYVILEDLDKSFMSWHNLKIWTDRYACHGEIKGAQVALSYDLFIVTSNYSPADLITGDDFSLLSAIRRRFKFIKFDADDYETNKRKAEEKLFDPPSKRVCVLEPPNLAQGPECNIQN